MAIIGGAQALTIAIIIVRAKVVAVLLGPSGTGLLSVFNNLRELSSKGAGLGLLQSGVRELSAAKCDNATLSRVRRVLLGALVVQGGIAMALIWLAREPLALWLLGGPEYSIEVGLVGIAVFLFLVSASHATLLQGMRRIGDLGRVTVWSTFLGTLAGLAVVIVLKQDGLIALIVLPPGVSLLVAWYYTRRLPPPDEGGLNATEIWQAYWPLVKLGLVLALGGLAMTVNLLLVRSRITQELGLDAAGHFAASWSITMIYVGFLLQAMAADYFPRLTEVIQDRSAANQLMNDQMQLLLVLGGPILLALIGSAPWLIPLLYSSEFAPAAGLLQWQTVGNVFKLAAVSLGFAFVAAARGGLYLSIEMLFAALFLLIVWFGLPVLGLEVSGIAFLLAWFARFVTIAFLVHHLQEFRWQRLSAGLLALHVTLATGLLVLARAAPLFGAAASLVLAFATAAIGGHIVLSKIGTHGRLVSKMASVYVAIGWPVKDRS